MLAGVQASSTAAVVPGPLVGLWRVGSAGSGGNYMVTATTQLLAPKRQLRQSHSASAYARQADDDYWDRHPTRWGDNRRVPMPMRRGIPFRGDILGSGYTGFRAVGS